MTEMGTGSSRPRFVCSQDISDTWLADLTGVSAHQGERVHSVTSMYLAAYP